MMEKALENDGITSVGPAVAKGTIANKATILSKAEWSRIQNQLTKREKAAEKQRFEAEASEKLHQLSVERTKTWKNTVQGKIKATLKAIEVRAELREEEKRVDDIEHASLAAENRKEAIKKARKFLYYETDRVRKFHSAMLLSEVLKERELQLEYNRLKAKADKEARLRSDYSDMLTNIEAFNSQSVATSTKQRNLARATAKKQLEQMREHAEQAEAESRDRQREGEEVDRLKREFEAETRAQQEARKERCRRLNLDNDLHLALTRRIRDIQLAQEEEADEAARHFARAKIDMMRKQYEKTRDQELLKEKRLERVQAKINSIVAAQPDRYGYLLDAAADRQVTDEERDRAAAAHRRQLALDDAQYMRQQMRRQEEERAADKSRDIELVLAREAAQHMLHLHEMEKLKLRYQRDLDLARHHVTCAEEKRQQVLKMKQKLTDEAVDRQKLIDGENGDFIKYAAKTIAERQRLGRDTRPMARAACAGSAGQGLGLGPLVTGNVYLLPVIATPGHHGDVRDTLTCHYGNNTDAGVQPAVVEKT